MGLTLYQTLGKFNHQTFKKGLIQTNAFRKSLIKNASQLRNQTFKKSLNYSIGLRKSDRCVIFNSRRIKLN